MDKSMQEKGGCDKSKLVDQIVLNAHVGEEYRSSCDGWVRPSSQAKCKTLVTFLQGHILAKNLETTSPSDDIKTKL